LFFVKHKRKIGEIIIPNKDDSSPQIITITCARRLVMILYNGQHMQKYRSNAIVVIRRVE